RTVRVPNEPLSRVTMASCTELADSDESVMGFLSSAAEVAAGLAPKRGRERKRHLCGSRSSIEATADRNRSEPPLPRTGSPFGIGVARASRDVRRMAIDAI